MRHMKNESEDNNIPSNDEILSPLIDEDSGGNSSGAALKKGPWTSAEDAVLIEYVKKHGEGNWNAVQKHSGLSRCGKSCRLRWANHLRPNLKKGAFTAEEEHTIIELHAKMGNKWARMAAHLPGRTDNEIKNYWNTRIKRRQRAGLPLYPPDVCMRAWQATHQQAQDTGGSNIVDKDRHDILQVNSYDIPDVTFHSLKPQSLPYIPNLPVSSCMMKRGVDSSQYCNFIQSAVHRQKRFRESATLFPGPDDSTKTLFHQFEDNSYDQVAQHSYGLPFPLDPNPTIKNAMSFGSFEGRHSLTNGNSSASQHSKETEKSELPSLQYPETDLSWETPIQTSMFESVDPFIQSAPTFMLGSDCPSPRNSGLLDALVYESKTMGCPKNHPSDKDSKSCSGNPGDATDSYNMKVSKPEFDEYTEAVSPFGQSTSSLFSVCTPISATGSSYDDPALTEAFSEGNVKSEPIDQAWSPDREKETKSMIDFTRPDVLFAPDWQDQSSGMMKDNPPNMTDAIAILLGDDLISDLKQLPNGISNTHTGWVLDSCPWNNMPAVCQMSDLP